MRTQTGQGMCEFLIVCTALAVALFLPYLHGESVITMLVRTLLRVARARSFLLSIF